MTRYDTMFTRLKAQKEGAFIPFVVLNDPDPKTCQLILETLIESGADALELGLPFSDPLADGPVIQKAGLRALGAGSTLESALALVQGLRERYEHIPIGLLTYANLIFKPSLESFYKSCAQAGIDSVLVADVPLLELAPYKESALKHTIATVLIAPPNLPKSRYELIASEGQAYTYVMTRSGVTGSDKKLALCHESLLASLKAHHAPPSIFGFGVSSPEHVRQALKEGASGVISGSHIVSLIEANLDNTQAMLKALQSFVSAMKAATKTI